MSSYIDFNQRAKAADAELSQYLLDYYLEFYAETEEFPSTLDLIQHFGFPQSSDWYIHLNLTDVRNIALANIARERLAKK